MAGLQSRVIKTAGLLACSFVMQADLFAQKTDVPVLTEANAVVFSNMVLKCANQEYPYKSGHTSEDSITNERPIALHPAFAGCFDWHSDVHGHWLLVEIWKKYPHLSNVESIIEQLKKDLDKDKIVTEAKYFDKFTLGKTFERPYGWAWLLKLDAALATWQENTLAQELHQNLQPLVAVIKERWTTFLPKQHYPDRSGMHSNTAFSLVLALDYANALGDTTFANLIKQTSLRYYGSDKNAPAFWEPNATDFLSPSLEEADLMRRVLSKTAFAKWFDEFFDKKSILHLMEPPVITDRNDYILVHLDGLDLSRAWCLRGIARTLGKNYPLYNQMLASADKHLNATLPYVNGGNYGGEHWLATFAVYALGEK